MATDFQVKHTLIHGTTGRGKGQTDTLLNPFDRRCAFWNLWQKATTASDVDNMTEALISLHGESDPY